MTIVFLIDWRAWSLKLHMESLENSVLKDSQIYMKVHVIHNGFWQYIVFLRVSTTEELLFIFCCEETGVLLDNVFTLENLIVDDEKIYIIIPKRLQQSNSYLKIVQIGLN